MTLLAGALLGAGVLLTIAPWTWPASRPRRPARRDHGALRRLMDEAGLAEVSVYALLAVASGCALAAAAFVWLVSRIPVLALLAALVAGWVPFGRIRARRLSLRRQRRALWPDVCDLLISSIRAGMSLPDAVGSLADSAPPPLRPAFAAFGRDVHATGRFDEALDRLKHTLADPVADRLVETVRMARQVGGTQLPSVLRALSMSVRADAAVRSEVEARQSWIRAAAVLAVVAPWVILGFLVTRPEGAEAYSTPAGVLVITVGAAVSVVSYRLMVRLGRLPESRRWFA